MNTFVLNLDPIVHLTDEQFYALCQANRDLKFERNAQGELIIVSPVGGEGGIQEADLITDLNNWLESRGAIMLRPSLLDPCVYLSIRTAPDSIRQCLCSCVCNRGNSHVKLPNY